jgi:glycine/D-amino acid oxidase-like deaminating enzyme
VRVVIVGAGVFGSALAWWLAREGEEVVLVDQFEPGDPRATSGGETRLIRCSHGDDADYSAMAWRALELWPEVAPGLLERCGMAWFAHREDGWEAESERTLTALGIPVAREDHPMAATDDLAFTLLEPEAGVLRAQRATQALAAGAVEAGAELVRGRAAPGGDGVATLDGGSLEGDAVVWACGGWLSSLFGDLVTLRVTVQNLFFYAGAWAGPAWVDYDAAMYGTGPIDGHGAKVAPDAEGPPCDPDADLPACDPANERLARAYIEARFPSLVGAPLTSSRACRYELSPDSHFLAGPHPEQPRTWLYGGGSGHGFKHGPALAERMAGALRGGPLPPVWAVGARAPGRSLRTAGSS